MEMQTSADTGQEHVTGEERRIIESAYVRGWGGGGHQVHVLVLSGKKKLIFEQIHQKSAWRWRGASLIDY